MSSRSLRRERGEPAGGACSPRDRKGDEWEQRYCGEASDWDVKEYLAVLP